MVRACVASDRFRSYRARAVTRSDRERALMGDWNGESPGRGCGARQRQIAAERTRVLSPEGAGDAALTSQRPRDGCPLAGRARGTGRSPESGSYISSAERMVSKMRFRAELEEEDPQWIRAKLRSRSLVKRWLWAFGGVTLALGVLLEFLRRRTRASRSRVRGVGTTERSPTFYR